jgi:hypothetical protein
LPGNSHFQRSSPSRPALHIPASPKFAPSDGPLGSPLVTVAIGTLREHLYSLQYVALTGGRAMSSSRTRCLAVIALVLAFLLGSSHGQVGTTRTEPAKPIPGFDLASLPVGKTIGIPPSSAKVRELLEQKGDFQMLCYQLGDLVTELRDKYKVPTHFDMDALTADGKGPDTILNSIYKDVTIRSMLRQLLPTHGLTYIVRDEFLIITTKTAAETATSTRLYQVHDLVLKPNDPAARPELNSLIELITSTIVPDMWREAGSVIGEIKGVEFPGAVVLVVSHNDDGHEQIEKLLADLRAAKVPAVYELQKHRERVVPVPWNESRGPPPGMSGASS